MRSSILERPARGPTTPSQARSKSMPPEQSGSQAQYHTLQRRHARAAGWAKLPAQHPSERPREQAIKRDRPRLQRASDGGRHRSLDANEFTRDTPASQAREFSSQHAHGLAQEKLPCHWYRLCRCGSRPPDRVVMPRALSALATARNDVAPVDARRFVDRVCRGRKLLSCGVGRDRGPTSAAVSIQRFQLTRLPGRVALKTGGHTFEPIAMPI